MNWWRVLKYTALAVGGLFFLVVVLSLVVGLLTTVLGLGFAVLGLLWGVISLLSALVVPALYLTAFGALVYIAYRVLTASGDTASATKSSVESQDDRVERLKDRYANGEITEQELERRLEREMGDADPIDRELQREYE